MMMLELTVKLVTIKVRDDKTSMTLTGICRGTYRTNALLYTDMYLSYQVNSIERERRYRKRERRERFQGLPGLRVNVLQGNDMCICQ